MNDLKVSNGLIGSKLVEILRFSRLSGIRNTPIIIEMSALKNINQMRIGSSHAQTKLTYNRNAMTKARFGCFASSLCRINIRVRCLVSGELLDVNISRE